MLSAIEYTIHHLRDPKTGQYTFDKQCVLSYSEADDFKKQFEKISGKQLTVGYHDIFGITIQVIIDEDGNSESL